MKGSLQTMNDLLRLDNQTPHGSLAGCALHIQFAIQQRGTLAHVEQAAPRLCHLLCQTLPIIANAQLQLAGLAVAIVIAQRHFGARCRGMS